MVRVSATLDRWQWLSDFFQDQLSIEKKNFKKMVSIGSVRVNKALVLEDLYVGPGSKILAYLEPKVYRSNVNVIKKSSLLDSNKPITNWLDARPDWTLVRKSSKHWLVIDKPAGISSIATRDFPRGTLVPFWLRKYLPRSLGSSGILTTSRLDVGTHGLIVVGRTSAYVAQHNEIIESRCVTKKYTAVVTGWTRPHIRKQKLKYSDSVKASFLDQSDELPQWRVMLQQSKHHANSSIDYDFFEFEADPYSPLPYRHIGLWEHFIPERTQGEKELPEPDYGDILNHEVKFGDFDHLRVVSSRIRKPGFQVPVKLIVEAARPATSDSVALRPFPKRWAENLIEACKVSGEPLYEVDIELLTGKTHQIRTQLECEGLLIVGDWLYGSPYLPDPGAFGLCCRSLSWTCPIEKTPVTVDLRELGSESMSKSSL